MTGTPKQIIEYLLEQDKEKVFEIKEHKEKRNLNQNAFYWKLINELALVIKEDKEKLHFDMLKHYSQRYEILVPSDYEIRGIEYYEKKSTISKNNKTFSVYMVYTPSHELKINEFALLLDGLIRECKQVGIDTRTYEEIKLEEIWLENENK